MTLSYIIPIRTAQPAHPELVAYVRALSLVVEVIVVDGSPDDVFRAHATSWADVSIHVRLDADVKKLANGKVAGVITGLRRSSCEHVVIADDDVRYDRQGLEMLDAALDTADVVRPQNYFEPLPWHAVVDTARILLNRISGGDWPGTLGVRRSMLSRTNGYDGDVMFENLELVRTVRAAGGVEVQRLDLYVRRLPPTSAHFWSQRVRQAYDEFARPLRLAMWLAVLPVALTLMVTGQAAILAGTAIAVILAAETGRRRAGGWRVFPPVASLAAPLWIAERAACAWLAVGSRLALGGIPYRGRILARAATPMRLLQSRFKGPDGQ
jgi:Glycosyl transferase family 2